MLVIDSQRILYHFKIRFVSQEYRICVCQVLIQVLYPIDYTAGSIGGKASCIQDTAKTFLSNYTEEVDEKSKIIHEKENVTNCGCI